MHPTRGHLESQSPSGQTCDKPSTTVHPPDTKPNPTNPTPHAKLGRVPHRSKPDLATLQSRLQSAIVQYPDWPKKGILFEDIMPIFGSAQLHADLMDAMELQIKQCFKHTPHAIVALESRGFFFGPSLALRLNCGFVPVRKPGKLPGPVETETFDKEYGQDSFEMQQNALRRGQKVLIVDDLIATGGSAAAAGALVRKSGAELMGYVFLVELGFLHGRAKLDAPVCTVLDSQSGKSRGSSSHANDSKQ